MLVASGNRAPLENSLAILTNTTSQYQYLCISNASLFYVAFANACGHTTCSVFSKSKERKFSNSGIIYNNNCLLSLDPAMVERGRVSDDDLHCKGAESWGYDCFLVKFFPSSYLFKYELQKLLLGYSVSCQLQFKKK